MITFYVPYLECVRNVLPVDRQMERGLTLPGGHKEWDYLGRGATPGPGLAVSTWW